MTLDAKTIAAVVSTCLALLGGAGGAVSYTGWNEEAGKFERAAAKYRAAKDLGRACMGDEAFDAEWADVLADLREAEGRE